MKRTTRWATGLWAAANIPAWEDEAAALWWRWAGRAARTTHREPTRPLPPYPPWKSTWWRKAMRGLHHSERLGAFAALAWPLTFRETPLGRKSASPRRHGTKRPRTDHGGKEKHNAPSPGSFASPPPVYSLRGSECQQQRQDTNSRAAGASSASVRCRPACAGASQRLEPRTFR